MLIKEIIKDCSKKMDKTIEYYERELKGVRTGRATTALIEYVKVDYYGSSTDLRDIAAVSVGDATQLIVKPYDPGSKNEIIKALETADLGLNPQADGDTIRISIPAPSSERRQQLATQVKKMGEESKIAIRNERRDAIKHVDSQVKDKSNDESEDDGKHGKEKIDSLTKKHTAKIDELCKAKTKEIQTI
ncbi:MAG TPA: ribosome recycling factor [Phycisphaerales bacterium]|jgi:ribosome recycling factor|nr:ribosome recycling factor [Phycisphaerales bacterium]|tara:strand:+ start:936 stop:1502 length:567 start_codon:yes stop_codon:yes gene_type:complete